MNSALTAASAKFPIGILPAVGWLFHTLVEPHEQEAQKHTILPTTQFSVTLQTSKIWQ